MAHDVFVSYSHHDKAQADAVCATLEAKGIRCWIAPRDVIQQPVGIVNFDAQSLREEIPVGATFFQEPDCLTKLVITRHLVLG